jgi:hypothetical protein
MQSIKPSSVMPREARSFRWLVRDYVATRLKAEGFAVPTSLLMVDQLVVEDGLRLVTRYDQKGSCFRCVDNFVSDSGRTLQHLVDSLPATKRSIKECITEVNRNVLLIGNVSWGRMVAVAGLITMVPFRCAKNEIGGVISLLIDQATLNVHESQTDFIRDNGGWSAFALAFGRKKEKEGGWLHNAFVAVAWVVDCISNFIS